MSETMVAHTMEFRHRLSRRITGSISVMADGKTIELEVKGEGAEIRVKLTPVQAKNLLDMLSAAIPESPA